ncbi:MAG: D-alanine--D-alanine ligase family protein [Oscillospiraceae bacterium]
MAKQKVAVLFGGVSSEHEVSLISASAIIENLPASQYEVLKIGITKKGRWFLYPGPVENIRNGSWSESADCVPAFISPDRPNHGLVVNHNGHFDLLKVDVVFPVLHGRNGEDGTVQGLLDLAGIPYVGCGLLASAMCMDKSVTNQSFDDAGLAQTPWASAGRRELDHFEALQARLAAKLRYPIFVKPAVGGSSVGVTKVHTPEALREAMMLAAAHDRTIVFEQAVQGREVECAVLGNGEPLASRPGEVVSCNEIYDYEAKYQSGDASKQYLPARLSSQKLEEVRAAALQAYRALGCAGLARVDFFIEEGTERVLINEINTMPGFTPISMYPKLMEMEGISFPALVERLIQLAFERAEG